MPDMIIFKGIKMTRQEFERAFRKNPGKHPYDIKYECCVCEKIIDSWRDQWTEDNHKNKYCGTCKDENPRNKRGPVSEWSPIEWFNVLRNY